MRNQSVGGCAKAEVAGGTQPPRFDQRTRVAASVDSTSSKKFQAFCIWMRMLFELLGKRLPGKADTGQTVPNPRYWLQKELFI